MGRCPNTPLEAVPPDLHLMGSSAPALAGLRGRGPRRRRHARMSARRIRSKGCAARGSAEIPPDSNPRPADHGPRCSCSTISRSSRKIRSVNQTRSGHPRSSKKPGFRAADGEQAEGAVYALFAVLRRVGDPQIHHRRIAIGPDIERLVGIFGADRHQVVELTGLRAAPLAQDGRFAQRLFAAFTRETVIHFDLARCCAHAAEARPHLPHLPAVQELMVHVHQVFDA